jgi:hypothetical protein
MSDDPQTNKEKIEEFEQEVTEKDKDALRRYGGILPFTPSVTSCSKFFCLFCLSACVILFDGLACHWLAVAQLRADEGPPPVTIKPRDLTGVVLTAEGTPAAGAKLALAVPGSQVFVLNGEIVKSQTKCEQHETDAAGKFHFAPAVDNSWLVVTHPSGFARVKCEPNEPLKTVQLTPWARAEGTYRVAGKLQPHVSIAYQWEAAIPFGPTLPQIFFQFRSTTDANGRFVFDRLGPGSGQIGSSIRLLQDNDATVATSSLRVPADFPKGTTTHIDLGTTGRPVIGQLRPRPGKSVGVPWSKAFIILRGNGRLARATNPEFRATVNRDGNFCIDDVPPGDYILVVFLFIERDLRPSLAHRFTVATINEKLMQRPVDLGVLTLEPAEARQ